jgi:hypothetical protein
MRRARHDDGELFPDIVEQLGLPTVSHAVRRVTCSGCGQPTQVPVGAVDLCRPCADAPEQTRVRIATLRASTELRLAAARLRYEQATHETDAATVAVIERGGQSALTLLTTTPALLPVLRAWHDYRLTRTTTAPTLARCVRAEAALQSIAPLSAT